ncbi:unnamed protein product [Adineta steineri]|uniref:Uncharacterized protein n=1 Tax=Adineta steineri TaxID=433720 RepID=A0A815U7H8_9BILA|nr:unnamed protein product [Adineta steineri]CAF4202493.1 unnamed protein product [Adineta steineri]
MKELTELNAIDANNLLSLSSAHYDNEHFSHETDFMSLLDYLARYIDDSRFDQIITKITYNDKIVEVF